MMLSNFLGSGGLNPLDQIGGPRSIQLALKLSVLNIRLNDACSAGQSRACRGYTTWFCSLGSN